MKIEFPCISADHSPSMAYISISNVAIKNRTRKHVLQSMGCRRERLALSTSSCSPTTVYIYFMHKTRKNSVNTFYLPFIFGSCERCCRPKNEARPSTFIATHQRFRPEKRNKIRTALTPSRLSLIIKIALFFGCMCLSHFVTVATVEKWKVIKSTPELECVRKWQWHRCCCRWVHTSCVICSVAVEGEGDGTDAHTHNN